MIVTNDFAAMVRRASTGGLTTLNQLRVLLWLGSQPGPVTARQCADGTGVTTSHCSGIFKGLENSGIAAIEVRVEWSMGARRSSLVAALTADGRELVNRIGEK